MHSSHLLQLRKKKIRRISYSFWCLVIGIVLFWNLLIVAAPIALLQGMHDLAECIYSFFGYICHQIDSRSLHFYGHKLAVCSRCFGFYAGLLMGFVVYPLIWRIEDAKAFSLIWLILVLIPSVIDWLLGVFGLWENTHLSRFSTAFLLGSTCAFYTVPALADLATFTIPRWHF